MIKRILVIQISVALLATGCLSESTKRDDYSKFAQLSNTQKGRIVWQLHKDKEWGKPDQKPICRDLLVTQAKYDANATAWTIDAIDLAEREGWTDLAQLIHEIYKRPFNIWIYERSFRYLRSQASKPVSSDLISASQILKRSGDYRSTITDEEILSAKQHFIDAPDKEAVLVYAIGVAGWHSGKGGTDRGRRAAADILRELDKDTVKTRLQQLFDDGPEYAKSEIGWIAKYLGTEMKSGQVPDKPDAGDGK